MLQQFVKQSEHAPGIKRALQRLRIALAGDVFEQLVHAAAPLEHRVVVFFGSDEMRQRELLGGQVHLKRVAKSDLKRIILSTGAAFQKKFAVIGNNQELGRLA